MTSRSRHRDRRSPLTSAAMAAYAGVLTVVKLNVSGGIPAGETKKNITYFVIDKATSQVVASLTLPDAANFANKFSMNVDVPRWSESYDVGTFSEVGEFVSAKFNLSFPGSTGGPTG